MKHFILRIMKNNRIKIATLSFFMNLNPFVYLYLNLEAIRTTTDINNKIAVPTTGAYTNSPSFFNLWYYIFQFKYSILIIYFIYLILSYYMIIINRLKNKYKTLIIGIIEILFIITFSFQPQFLIPLLLLLNFALLILITLKTFYQKKSLKICFILLISITFIGTVLNKLVQYYSLNGLTFNNILTKEETLFDINHLENLSRYLLFYSFTQQYFMAFLALIAIIIIFKFVKKIRFLLSPFIIGSFLVVILIIRLTILGTSHPFFISSNDRQIKPIQGCYKNAFNLGLGQTTLHDGQYFDHCFDTTVGLLTVYKEIKTNDNNPFNLLQDSLYTNIFITNQMNEEILSVPIVKNEIVHIYATTTEEYNNGYNNLIIVESYFPDDYYHHYSFYDINGQFLLELPDGIADHHYMQEDLLDITSMKISFINDQLIYHDGNELYTYNIDGTYVLGGKK